VTSPDPVALDLVFSGVGHTTVLTRRRYRWPLLIGRVFPDPVHRGAGVAIIQNAAGTIIPGDRIRMLVTVTEAGFAVLRGQGATTVAGLPEGATATEVSRVHVEGRSTLVMAIPPRILTAHAHYRQHTEVCVESDATLVLVDGFVVHPDVTHVTFGCYESTVDIRSGAGEILAIDTQRLVSLPRMRHTPKAFGSVFVVCSADDPLRTRVLREMAPIIENLAEPPGRAAVYPAVSALPNDAGVLVRIAAADGGSLRSTVDTVVSMVVSALQPSPVAG